LFVGYDPPGELKITRRRIDPDPTAESSLKILDTWIKDCLNNHDKCSPSMDFFPPSRLIYIEDNHICLRDMLKSTARGLKYAALSHCWGTKHLLVTTKQNLQAHKITISIQDMPQTFQDAVTMTVKLGLQYLWIDSICIIQDSEEDWIRECADMGSYYSNAFITLSALQAKSDEEGFLHPRKVPKKYRLPPFLNLYVQEDYREEGMFQNAALSCRGWCLQERLLSRRLLHFTDVGMVWECNFCTSEECMMEHTRTISQMEWELQKKSEWLSDDARKRGLTNSLLFGNLNFKQCLRVLDDDDFSEVNGAFRVWRYIVKDFTRRQMKFTSDRLPAISGIAALIATKTNSQYLAGVWAADLRELVWRSLLPCTSDRSQYLAPSWSWATCSSPVDFKEYWSRPERLDKDPHFVASHLLVSDGNPLGRVTGGYIVISAFGVPVTVTEGEKWNDLSSDGALVETTRFRLQHFGKRPGFGYFDRLNGAWESRDGVYALCIYGVMFSRTPSCFCLLIEKSNLERDMWRRIGTAQLNIDAFEKSHRQPWALE
jgi:hypothetical protein